MAEFVAMPLWTDAYLGDTHHLSTLQHGAYMLLLITAWRSKDGTLPNDDKILARYSGLTLGQWKKVRPILQAFFTVTNDVWIQGRLNDERKAVRQKSKRQSDKAKTRWLKTKETPDTEALNGHEPKYNPAMPPLPLTPTLKKEIKNKEKNGGSASRAETHATPPLNSWQQQLANRIGEKSCQLWFGNAEMDAYAIYVPKAFQVQKIQNEMMHDIEAVFGKPYEIKLKDAQ